MSILVTPSNLNHLVGQYPRLEPIANAGISFNIAMPTDNKLRAFKKRGPRPLTNPANIEQVRLADSTHDAKSRAKLINGMLLRINTKGDDVWASLVKGSGDWYAFNACDRALIKLVVVKDRRNGVSVWGPSGLHGTTLEEQYAFVYDTLVEEATNRHRHLLIFRNRTPAGR
ncbi:hypothetical protein K504DRAFT_467114 [Pleomassaria siparia CBS 279.74]|uniref:Uncharacterized protein n=1 Tax=Pleomassaria siparia CBS 279.74 TaxID=1314801 RepID=A0A6G1JQ94_9PLEO|nr:hypothetical protein K504DRAFT_467114 [Pleomassaria siparia CBS 279.74]